MEEEKKLKKSIHLNINYEVWKEYKKFCANLNPEEHASNREEKFMRRELKRKKAKNGNG